MFFIATYRTTNYIMCVCAWCPCPLDIVTLARSMRRFSGYRFKRPGIQLSRYTLNPYHRGIYSAFKFVYFRLTLAIVKIKYE